MQNLFSIFLTNIVRLFLIFLWTKDTVTSLCLNDIVAYMDHSSQCTNYGEKCKLLRYTSRYAISHLFSCTESTISRWASHNNFSLLLGLTVTFFKVVSFSFCVVLLKPFTSQVYFGNALLPIVTRAISLNFCLRFTALFERTLPFETPCNTTITKSL